MQYTRLVGEVQTRPKVGEAKATHVTLMTISMDHGAPGGAF